MANNDNIIYAKFNHGREITTDSRSQYAYGQVLKISGLHLPASFDADVSNKGDKQAKAVIGTDNELPIDDAYFLSGKDVIVMINVHAADKDGRTKYIIRIPVEKRPERADIKLEPVEQDVISTAIATLNEAIEQTSANAESAENSANRAQQSAIDAETSATNASNSEALVQQYMERAETAAENAEQSETKAKASEDNAKASEEHAEQIASDIEQFTERAETASTNAESSASTASQYATSASNSANIATVKASEASTSAENASRSAINATGQATIATQKAELAELHATNASNSASEAYRYERMAQSEAQSASQAASMATTARDEARTARNQAQTAKTQAETAKTQAQTANTNAQSAATRASTSATSASQSATSAEESAQSALASKTAIENMSVTAQTLNPDQQATATKEVDSETGAITINYGIPKGVKGDTGEQGIQGEKGDQGIQGVQGEKGEKGDTGAKGDKGDSGTNGANGISPTVSITAITGGHRIIITDADGQHSADVMDGDDYTLTQQDKADIAGLVNIPVDDVQIENNSIVDNGIANIPIASTSQAGVAYINTNNGIGIQNGYLFLCDANSGTIKLGNHQFRAIVPLRQHESVFYGLAKASGDTTQSQSSNAVGTYTDEAKTSIQSMLGVPSEDEVITDVQINGTSIVSDGIAEIPIASTSALGVITCAQDYGITVLSNGRLQTTSPSDAQLKSGSSNYRVITPTNQHKSVFYGLAKASGDTTQSESDNAVGTYTDDAKASIQSMLGVPSEDEVVTDVQIDGTSIVSDGVANIPIANGNDYGVVKINAGYGITLNSSNALTISRAGDTSTKEGTEGYKPITPVCQHHAVFYGLAKAAGADEKNSTLPVGQYTDSAQTAIKQMLGVKDDYDSLVVEVSGTDPVITGKASYRYNCGELYTLSITPPESGTMDIIFTSGATPTVLTLPNTVKMPTWWAGIETNTTYEMCITDGVYCGVMSWAT